MSNTSDEKKDEVVKRLKSERRLYFVPGRGQLEATDLEDVAKQVKKLEEQEAGDGDI